MSNKKNSPRMVCPQWVLFLIPILGMWALYQLNLHVKKQQQQQPISIKSDKSPSQVYSVSEELHRYITAMKKDNWLINGSIGQYSTHNNLVASSLGHVPSPMTSQSSPAKFNGKSGRNFYTVFSTDCTPFQDWQSIVLFHSATAVGQRGFVVRIASGCSQEKSQQLLALYQKLFPDSESGHDPLRVRLHVTPDFSKDEKTNNNYHFYNKPRGFQHWLQRTQGEMGAETIIALVDPDFVFLRPLDGRVRGANNSIFSSSYKPADMDFDFVTKGKPVAQMYGLGAPWTNDNHKHFKRGAICGEGSPCLLPTPRFGERHYAVGPPYILHMDDWKRLADSWTLFVPRVYEGYPHLLAEMYAYSMAAAHERLPHLQAEHMMVSCTECYGEGWRWVDKLENVCMPPVYSSRSSDAQGERFMYYPGHELPTFLHYCQSFKVNAMSFYKRHLRTEIFNFSSSDSPGCTQKFFEIPPPSVGRSLAVPKDTPKKEHNKLLAKRRDVFMYCVMHHSLNAAISFARGRLCS